MAPAETLTYVSLFWAHRKRRRLHIEFNKILNLSGSHQFRRLDRTYEFKEVLNGNTTPWYDDVFTSLLHFRRSGPSKKTSKNFKEDFYYVKEDFKDCKRLQRRLTVRQKDLGPLSGHLQSVIVRRPFQRSTNLWPPYLSWRSECAARSAVVASVDWRRQL